MPSLSNKTDVLVVGAGPVGLVAALELSRAGVVVEVIDKAWRSTAHSYACGLHASSLELLASLGLESALLEAGRPIDSLAFYEGSERRAELHFGTTGTSPRGLLVVPQDRLEALLEEAVRQRGIHVHWGHRLDDLRQSDHTVDATVEKLTLTSVGYPFARSEEMVERDFQIEARFVLGADGASSHVRQILGIPFRPVARGMAYEIFEFEPAHAANLGNEVRVAFGNGSAHAYWPQPGSTCRWSLELPHDTSEEHPGKERTDFVIWDQATNPQDLAQVQQRIQAHAPWFTEGIKEIDWHTVVGFEPGLADRFGIDRCWLAGDAAHQTSPVGMQSMNVGLREAVDLARAMARVLVDNVHPSLLEEYQRQRANEWELLLGRSREFVPSTTASKWVASHRRRLLPCLPGSGTELVGLAAQIGLVPGPG